MDALATKTAFEIDLIKETADYAFRKRSGGFNVATTMRGGNPRPVEESYNGRARSG
jgi:hypothetical protein